MRNDSGNANWLRTFEAAARHGNITQAADELGLTQAAASKHIQSLEARLSVQLLVRGARGVTATTAGLELQTAANHAFQRIDATLGRISRVQNSEVLVVSNASFANHWLMAHLPDFAMQHPELRLNFRNALWSRDLIGMDADAHVFLGPMDEKDARLIAPADLRLVSGIGATDRIIRVAGFERAFDQVEGTELMEVDSFYAARELVLTIPALTICPAFLVEDHLRDGRLIAHDTLKTEKRAYWCRAHTPSGQIFADWLISKLNVSTKSSHFTQS
ncbi:LysR family transcriptional regulator [Phaeobacter inhibens]|uniref:LysR family transcriptional regulator n=1 Tax=Phaeobacter inhibens TaxID=221822 RepID=UPI0001632A45|nr:LysR family transcriptional regulator [Phaeobacter inhibens]AFO93017.1 putative HTH-type transcriptional regulator, LysR family [Phaeobacter inhibens DSM 17395]AUQ47718.1 putative HTH-type transcriptional regulator, LysR family [Phaeobacter inhibens]